jgi:hypothetical protein
VLQHVVPICFNVVSHMDSNDFGTQPLVHAEISVIPIISSRGDNKNTNSGSGMSKYIHSEGIRRHSKNRRNQCSADVYENTYRDN